METDTTKLAVFYAALCLVHCYQLSKRLQVHANSLEPSKFLFSIRIHAAEFQKAISKYYFVKLKSYLSIRN